MSSKTKRVFIDTSIFIRFLTQDDQVKYRDCVEFFKLVENGSIRPYTSNIVILEIIYVLVSLYKFPKEQVLKAIEAIFKLRNLVLIDKTDTVKALRIFKETKIKYGDCLIVSQMSDLVLITYDTEFNKIHDMKVVEPADLVK